MILGRGARLFFSAVWRRDASLIRGLALPRAWPWVAAASDLARGHRRRRPASLVRKAPPPGFAMADTSSDVAAALCGRSAPNVPMLDTATGDRPPRERGVFLKAGEGLAVLPAHGLRRGARGAKERSPARPQVHSGGLSLRLHRLGGGSLY